MQLLIVHHTLQPGSDYAQGDVVKLLRGIYNYHTGASKGWPDIAYNFFVDKYGGIWEGRTDSIARPVQGSATGGNQGFTQLCCFLGDLRVEPPSPPAQHSMVSLLAWLADRYAIDTTPGATVQFVSRGSNRWPAGSRVTASTLSAHRDMSLTECPGDACYPLVTGQFPAQVHALVGGRPAAPTSSKDTIADAPTSSESTVTDTTTSAPTTKGSTAQATETTPPDRDLAPHASDDGDSWLVAGGAVGLVAGTGLGLEALRRRRRDHDSSREDHST